MYLCIFACACEYGMDMYVHRYMGAQVCICMCVCVHPCVSSCVLTLSVSLDCSLSFVLSQDLSCEPRDCFFGESR